MRDVIGMILLVEGDGHLGDAMLSARFIRLGASKDHKAALALGELVGFLLGAVCRVAGLGGRLLGLALLAEGATNVALHGSTVLEEMLHLPPMEQVGGLECLLKVFRACSAPTRLRFGDAIGRGDHLLPMALSVLVLPVVASLR
jgi:hypothetical protein